MSLTVKTFFVWAILLSHPDVPAQAANVLFNQGGRQRLEEVFGNGGLATDVVVVWDERRDGALPKDAPIGYATRALTKTGKPTLVPDLVMKAAMEKYAAAAAETAAREAAAAESVVKEKAALQTLKEKIDSGNATTDEIKQALKIVVEKILQQTP